MALMATWSNVSIWALREIAPLLAEELAEEAQELALT
jgi:hypothetical protein